jgi:hypothetical protein
MKRVNLRFIKLAPIFFVLIAMPQLAVSAKGKKQRNSSEIVVQRVDNNTLIRLRVYIDARSAGTLRVGETNVYRVSNGSHTLRAAFEDYYARSTEVMQFSVNNSRLIFTVTDESIVMTGYEMISSERPVEKDEDVDKLPVVSTIEMAVRNSFERATEKLKKKTKIAVVNVDSDNNNEGIYVLEELTYLAVQSPKKFTVIDRRMIDAFRVSNGVGVPSYNNDYILMLIGKLLGADIVMSGRIDGSGELRRLRVKALDVNTGMIVGNASERP